MRSVIFILLPLTFFTFAAASFPFFAALDWIDLSVGFGRNDSRQTKQIWPGENPSILGMAVCVMRCSAPVWECRSQVTPEPGWQAGANG